MVQENQATITFIQLMKEDLGIFRLLPNDGQVRRGGREARVPGEHLDQ